MQEDSSRQQVTERIKQASNILVTVSTSPSVDALSAALGLTLMLNKLNKHATAVFSGVLPPAISFLEPGKTFENNVDSLRDFIIALDKNKADHLRYKVEDDVVRIFITPYRTTITEKDLQFSQGDFNVDLIIALGVEKRSDLDKAITAHGRILHDATVITINADSKGSSLGAIDWPDGTASSLSEMLAGLAEELQKGLLDQQISTALLTGLVSATERFSNQRTTPRVMTLAAQLMAAGANQQLIATQLKPLTGNSGGESATGRPVADGDSALQNDEELEDIPDDTQTAGEMHIDHSKPSGPKFPKRPKGGPPDPEGALAAAEEALAQALPMAPPAAQQADDLKNDLKKALEEDTPKPPADGPKPQSNPQDSKDTKEPETDPETGKAQANDQKPTDKLEPLPEIKTKPLPKLEPPAIQPATPLGPATADGPSLWQGRPLDRPVEPPTFGGTLNATAEQALEDAKHRDQDDRNQALLSHDGAPAKHDTPAVPTDGLPPLPPQPGASDFSSLPPVPQPPAGMAPPAAAPAPMAGTLADLEQAIGGHQGTDDESQPSGAAAGAELAQSGQAASEAPAASAINEDEARRAVHEAFNVLPPSPDAKSALEAAPAAFEALPGPDPLPPVPAAGSQFEPPKPAGPDLSGPPPAPLPAAPVNPSFDVPQLPPPPPMPDFNTLPTPPALPEPPASPQLPAASDMPGLPPAGLPPAPPELIPPESPAAGGMPSAPQPQQNNNPGQFKIPGQ